MASNDKLHPFWFHVIVTGLVCLGLTPIAGAVYVGCVAIYYCGKWAIRVVQAGPRHNWYYATRRLLWSLGLSLASAVIVAAATFSEMSNADEQDVAGAVVATPLITLMLTPFWFVGLLILSLPLRLFRWMQKQNEKRESQRRSEQHAREHAERQRQQQEATRRQQTDQTRRTEARAQCELLYTLHAPEIADRFPKSMLDAFMHAYMSDAHAPEDVERRGKELQRIIEQHRQTSKPEKKPRTIQELAEWYLAEKARIEALPLDEEIKEDHRVQLDIRYSELTQSLLQKIEP